ncbi:GNAT family N-acetyltransferase [Saccharothrix variisporea]|uniref:Acetyltransferase (GNAT) family protein n=1 Tax=Saccharothrix variisporea TaxID=543527 RepID=A0A495X859_9PSEU|nr:GNAT family N-acetyltransferase [Saccharothrix variisporea]RKT69064.1 acetyltransferase (GNAT) family protein [Saccharothrix variisporea]
MFGPVPTPPPPVIRPATVLDAAEIARIHVQAWQAAYAGHMPAEFLNGLSVADRQAAWERQLAQGTADVFVIEAPDAVTESAVAESGAVAGSAGSESAGAGSGGAGSVIAGFALVGPSRDADAGPGTGELHAINLDPAHWHRRLGRPLLDHAVTALRDRGYRDATLWVLGSNDRARRFYERAGWAPDGTTRVETIAGGTVRLEEVRYRRTLVTATVV